MIESAPASIASPALEALPHLRCRGGGTLAPAWRTVPEEAAVAFVYNGQSRAVMMATPHDLEDFAVGFSLAEGIVAHAREITALDVHHAGDAVELRMTLETPQPASACAEPCASRLTGPSGCGLCGVTSLGDALRPVALVPGAAARFRAGDIAAAMRALGDGQQLNREAHALHAAALWRHDEGLVALREDIGRHCALDKLAGAVARRGLTAAGAAVLLTSRVSVELVHKSARLGAALLVAVSAPTALAVRTAQACGMTLVAVARGGDFEVFSHAERIG